MNGWSAPEGGVARRSGVKERTRLTPGAAWKQARHRAVERYMEVMACTQHWRGHMQVRCAGSLHSTSPPAPRGSLRV